MSFVMPQGTFSSSKLFWGRKQFPKVTSIVMPRGGKKYLGVNLRYLWGHQMFGLNIFVYIEMKSCSFS
jgi:hypothetical protein